MFRPVELGKAHLLSHRAGWGQRAAAALLLLAAPASAQELLGPTMASFDPLADPAYGDPRPALRAYLARTKLRSRAPQRFCVIGYRAADGDKVAQVHWITGRRLIRWEGTDPDHPDSLLTWARRDYDLLRDPVATEAEIAGSTYLITRAFADGIVTDCARRGRAVVVTRR